MSRSTFERINVIIIPKQLMERFIDIALKTDIEVGGLLIGRLEGDKARVRELIIGENIRESPVRFELDAQTFSKALKTMRGDEDIIGIIHSHPSSPYPSQIDMENMQLWPVIWVILDKERREYRAWHFDREIKMVIKD